MKFKFLISLVIFFTSYVSLSAQSEQSKKILFIGNSYTYFWNLPQTLNIMSLNDSIRLDTRQSTSGGVSLRQHWNQENNLKTMDIINQNQFDIIILQDHSLQAINKPDSLLYYGKLFGDLIKKRGAKIYLYLTWARENDLAKQQKINVEYERLAKEINATIIPVGPIWEKVIKDRPDLKLFDDDGSHPSLKGTYLAACMFYKTISGKSPVGLPHRIMSTDTKGEKLYLNILSEETAKYFQRVVDDY
jgi:hypothetical protein